MRKIITTLVILIIKVNPIFDLPPLGLHLQHIPRKENQATTAKKAPIYFFTLPLRRRQPIMALDLVEFLLHLHLQQTTITHLLPP